MTASRVIVAGFELESAGDRQDFVLKLVRLGERVRWVGGSPPADDVPPDVRRAVLAWLSAPINDPLSEGDLADVTTALRDGAAAIERDEADFGVSRPARLVLSGLADELEVDRALLYRAAP